MMPGEPAFVASCDWSKLDGGNWVRLLFWRPELVEKCDWDKLSESDRETLRRCWPDDYDDWLEAWQKTKMK
jgi:hypothetical protein